MSVLNCELLFKLKSLCLCLNKKWQNLSLKNDVLKRINILFFYNCLWTKGRAKECFLLCVTGWRITMVYIKKRFFANMQKAQHALRAHALHGLSPASLPHNQRLIFHAQNSKFSFCAKFYFIHCILHNILWCYAIKWIKFCLKN